MKRTETLFGSEVIQLLIPHRAPFLMVDAVDAIEPGDRPTLRACRHISANEPVFAGHFPELHIWPGVLTIEGLGQSCLLLSILVGLDSETLAALENLHRGYRLHGGYRPNAPRPTLDALGPASARMGFGAAIDVKLVAPVFAGQRLDYRVMRTHTFDQLSRFDVEASVDGRPVAQGTMSGKGGILVPVS
jgi:3-hydroxyacyl-[acyl-carrier-protein] dehydratase